jgi:hypothetical protein
MAAAQFMLPYRPAFDSNAKIIPGAQLWFTLTGTDTPSPVYSDAGLTTPLVNPVVANSVGRFAPIYYDDSISYRARLYLSDAEVGVDDPEEEFDPYIPGFEDTALRSLVGAALPSVLDYIPSNLHTAILNFTSTADVTSYFVAGWAAKGVPLLVPPGLYNVTSIAPPSKTGLVGLGRQSIIKQLTTASDTASVISVSGVTDVRIENLEVRGIIAQFDHTRQNGTYPKPNNSEFNHGISIRADDGATTERITVRNCFFQDIRGDGISVFEADAGTLAEIDLFQNAGTNVLRIGVSVVGGHRGRVKGAHFPICGYAVIDFESEGAYSDPVEGWTVEDVYGPVVQVAGNADTFNNRVKLRNIVTDGSLANTTPPYLHSSGLDFHDVTSSIRCRNVIRLDIDGHYPKNHTGHAIFYVSDATPTYATSPILQLRNFEYDATIGTSEAVYNANIVWSPVNAEVYIEDGKETAYDNSQTLLWMSGAFTQQVSIKNVQTDGSLVVNAKSVSFENIRANLSSSRGLTTGCQKLHFLNCPFLSAGLIGYNTSSIILENSIFAIVGGGSGYGGTIGPVLLVNSTFGAITRTGYGLYSAADLTGWTAGTGTPNKGAFAAYGGATMSAAYVQAEAQATNDAAKAASQRLLALENAVRALTNMLGAS